MLSHRRGRSKQGGVRVIYYWPAAEDHVYLLTLYRKGVKDNLTRTGGVAHGIEND